MRKKSTRNVSHKADTLLGPLRISASPETWRLLYETFFADDVSPDAFRDYFREQFLGQLSVDTERGRKWNQFFVDAIKIQSAIIYDSLRKKKIIADELIAKIEGDYKVIFLKRDGTPDIYAVSALIIDSIYKHWLEDYQISRFDPIKGNDPHNFRITYIQPGKKLIRGGLLPGQKNFITSILRHIEKTEQLQKGHLQCLMNAIKNYPLKNNSLSQPRTPGASLWSPSTPPRIWE